MSGPTGPDEPPRTRRRSRQEPQRGRARVMALLLGLFVLLVFAISIVKIQLGHGG